MSKEEIKKELEKQLQLLSKLSDNKDLRVTDHLGITEAIRNVCFLLLTS